MSLEELYDPVLPRLSSLLHRGLARAPVSHVRPGAVGEKQPHKILVAVSGGDVKRRVPVPLYTCVNIGTVGQEQLHDGLSARPHGGTQGRGTSAGGVTVSICASGEQKLHHVLLPNNHRRIQGRNSGSNCAANV